MAASGQKGQHGSGAEALGAVRRVIEGCGFTFMLRDDQGNLAGGDPAWVEGRPDTDVGFRVRGDRFYDAKGRELPLLRHPSHIVRTTGERQRPALLGVRRDGAPMWWLQAGYVPVECGPGGWSVVGIAADVTELVTQRDGAEERAQYAEGLLALSEGISLARDVEGIAGALVGFAERALPDAMVTLGVLEGPRRLRYWTARNPTALECAPAWLPLTGDMLARWEHLESHVNLAVSDDAVYGQRVIGSSKVPVRSTVIVPVFGRAGRLGNLGMASPLSGAFNARQIATLERAAGFIGGAIDELQRRAAA